jgi:hypothetical protein
VFWTIAGTTKKQRRDSRLWTSSGGQVGRQKKMNDEQKLYDVKKRLSVAEPRPKFARLSCSRPLAVKQMAARIKFLIEFFSEDGNSMRMQEVRRGLHACRYLEFDDAIKLLEQRRRLVIHRVSGRGHVSRVVLKQNARAKLPDPFVFHRKKRRKRKRPPSQWFLERRPLMDAGQHEGFSQIEAWSESAFWIEKEKMQD